MRIDVADLTDTAAYRILTDTVVPRPVAWVSTLGPDGVRNLAPFSFFQAIGGAPPTVIVSVARHSDGSFLGFIGEPTVHVLALNLDLDGLLK